MDDKFRNKYRISSARLQNWDYASEGAYFITICTKDRLPFFGKIENGKMILSNIGVIADLMWYEIKNHSKNIELGEFVVMPNHVHGVLILNVNGLNTNVETLHATSLPPTEKNKFMSEISPKSNSISTIIRSYKSAVTKHGHRLGFKFEWQSRFYDHIIRDAKSFENIQNYIVDNPLNWGKDKFYANE
ncbi:REP element-mobilizing transposase RayT [Dyadobacter jejuensis]|uniref:REP element-mobilizing transposase RayT n=1 Tax=Dyadobacter jejuensis TaxID=1082580 RepID=A0A316AHV6_9BACT|nr:transposase [Dyadobacter jejuensis]PWJ56839.1 REP element-mobilizing transposase RayT [Dyadobacter jejuensis]